MAIRRDEVFNDEPVALDANTYERCTFTNCELVYAGGQLPTLISNTFSNCRWTFAGAAARTVQFMSALYSGGGRELIEHTIDNIRGKGKGGLQLN